MLRILNEVWLLMVEASLWVKSEMDPRISGNKGNLRKVAVSKGDPGLRRVIA